MAREYLPGLPPPKLVREVRRHLRHYGMTPRPGTWRLAWAWASSVRNSYVYPRWPSPNEIGAQYVALLLADMRAHFALKLPPRAAEKAPPAVLAALGGAERAALAGTAADSPNELPAHEPAPTEAA